MGVAPYKRLIHNDWLALTRIVNDLYRILNVDTTLSDILTPPGSDGEVIYNKNDVYGADSTFSFDDVTKVLTAQVLKITTVAAASSDTDKFLVDDSDEIKFRTGAQLLSDIGGSASGHLHDTQTLQHDGVNSDGGAFGFTTSGAVTFNQNILTTGATVTNCAVLGSDSAVFQPNADSTTFFQLKDQAGNVDFNYDSTNGRIVIGRDSTEQVFEVFKDYDGITRFSINNPNVGDDAGTNLRFYQGADPVADNFFDNSANRYLLRTAREGADLRLGAGNSVDYVSILSTGEVGIRSMFPIHPLEVHSTKNAITGTNIDVSELTQKFRNVADDNNEALGIGFGLSSNAANVGAAIIHKRVGSQSYGNLHFATKPSGSGAGANIPIRVTILYNGNVGFNELDPETLIELTHATPIIQQQVSTHTNADDARKSIWRAKGNKTDETEHTLGQFSFSHDGTGNDFLAKYILSLNKNAGADTLSDILTATQDSFVIQAPTDSATFFQVKDEDGNTFANIDTINELMTLTGAIGSNNPQLKLEHSSGNDATFRVGSTGILQIVPSDTAGTIEIGDKTGSPNISFLGDTHSSQSFNFYQTTTKRAQFQFFDATGENMLRFISYYGPIVFQGEGNQGYWFWNDTHEDSDGGRESKLDFLGEQSGGERSTLVRIEASHIDDGVNADDQKGQLKFYYNADADGDSPTLGITLNYLGTSIGDGGVTNYVGIDPTGVVSLNGLAGLQLPHMMQSDSTNQTVSSANVAQVVTFNTDVHHFGITRTTSSRFTILKEASYLIAISALCDTTVANKDIEVWLRINGSDVANSNTIVHLGTTAETTLAVTYIKHFDVGDYFEFWMTGENAGCRLLATAAVTTGGEERPACPSIIMTCNYIGVD